MEGMVSLKPHRKPIAFVVFCLFPKSHSLAPTQVGTVAQGPD